MTLGDSEENARLGTCEGVAVGATDGGKLCVWEGAQVAVQEGLGDGTIVGAAVGETYAVNMRTTQLVYSATYTLFPLEYRAKIRLNCALVASPLSPAYPPVVGVMTPNEKIMKLQSSFAIS